MPTTKLEYYEKKFMLEETSLQVLIAKNAKEFSYERQERIDAIRKQARKTESILLNLRKHEFLAR